jgi:uncharacterized protein (TIGR02246 family)
MTEVETAHAFVDAINSRNPDRLAELMTDNHTFVDSDGSEHSGREAMRRGWREYFSMVPDFRIEVKETLVKDDTVVLLGFAEGTFDQDGELKVENHWLVPAAWRVKIQSGLVAVWQLYVNPDPMVEIYKRIEAG